MVESRGRADGLLIIALVVVGLALLVTARLGARPQVPGPSDSAAATPTTTPANIPSGTPHEILLAVGDIGYCDSSTDDQVGELAARLPGTIALLGDIAYPRGSSGDFANCFDPAWGDLGDRLRPVPGNHEYETKRASGYFSYFGAAVGDPAEGWYSYDLGGWHVVALNSVCDAIGGCGRGSRQLAWLVADLEAHPVACTLAHWHHPRYSSGRHGDDDMTDALWDALAAANADVVLFGHDHDYERMASIDGMRSFVVGTGGRSLYAWPEEPGPQTEVRANDTYGLLELRLAAAAYSWRFIPAGGGTFTDAGSGSCQ